MPPDAGSPFPLQLYLATGNPHKVGELTAILRAGGITAEVLPPSALGGMPEVVEDTGTFEGNARKKALALAGRFAASEASGGSRLSVWAVADDSGLCVDAFDGAPGVESAYYAGRPTRDAANNARLLAALASVPGPKRTATFHCCIVAAAPSGSTFAFEGRCPGRILDSPRGQGGFGYDPLFLPDGFAASYSELDVTTKNRISHRARALARFMAWLKAGSPSSLTGQSMA